MSWDNVSARYHDTDSYDGRYPPDWDERRLVYRRDDYTCKRCDRVSGPHAGENGATLHAHHQKPLSEGGSNHPSNLITLCGRCHNDVHEHDIFAGQTSPDAAGPATGDSGQETQIGTGHSRIIATLGRAGKTVGGGILLFVCHILAIWCLNAVNGVWSVGGLVSVSAAIAGVCARYPRPGVVVVGGTVLRILSVAMTGPEGGVVWAIFGTVYFATGPVAGCFWAWFR